MRDYRREPHIRPREEEKIAVQNGFKTCRRIVDLVHSWFNQLRKLPVRYEKTNRERESLLQLDTCVIILEN